MRAQRSHVERLRAMEQLQSYQKEVDEGKINALVILSRELRAARRAQGVPQEIAYQQAEARVQADIVTGLERLTALREAPVTNTGKPEAAIDNIARFVCDVYTHHDYHTFLAQAA